MTDPRIVQAIAADPIEATLAEFEGRWALTMHRDLPYPPERIWRMLTDPTQLARWSPVVPDRPLTDIGPAHAQETPEAPVVDAEVLVVDAPRELVHRWGTHLLRWALARTATGTGLTLANTLDEPADGHRNAAGWHLCLAVLAAILDGEAALEIHPVERVVGIEAMAYGWAELDRAYADVI